MSYRDDNIEKRTSKSRIRLNIIMDIGMGIFYAVIGIILLYAKSFGNMQIPAYAAYTIGTLLAIGGAFRFYRGIKAVLPRKKDTDQTSL